MEMQISEKNRGARWFAHVWAVRKTSPYSTVNSSLRVVLVPLSLLSIVSAAFAAGPTQPAPETTLPSSQVGRVQMPGQIEVHQEVGPLGRIGLGPAAVPAVRPQSSAPANVVALAEPPAMTGVGANARNVPSGVQVVTVSGPQSVSAEANRALVPVGPAKEVPLVVDQGDFKPRPIEITSDGLPEGRDIDLHLSTRLGDIVATEREQLFRRADISVDYFRIPSEEVIYELASAAGINILMPEIESRPLTLRANRNAFRLLDDVVTGLGLGLVRKDAGMFVITQVDRKTLVPHRYELQNIRLDREFSFRDGVAAASSSSSGAMGGTGSSSNSGGNAGSSLLGSSGAGNYDKVTNRASSLPPVSVASREQSNSVLKRIKEIMDSGLGALDPDKRKITFGAKTGGDAKDSANDAGGDSGSPVYDADSNSIYVVTTEEKWQWIQEFIQGIDQPLMSVEVTLRFVAESKGNGKKQGVDWTGGDKGGFGNGIVASVVGDANTTPTTTGSGTGSSTTSNGIQIGRLGSKAVLSVAELEARLHLLATQSGTKVKQKAPMAAGNNRELVYSVTKNYPVVLSSTGTNNYAGGSTTTSGVNVSNEEVGTVVRVLGQSVRNGIVNLNISVEFSNVEGTVASNGIAYPVIKKNRIDTSLPIMTGATLVLSGLEEAITTTNIQKIPVLGDMPILGWAFKDLVNGDTMSSLSMMVTVRLVDASGNPIDFQKQTAAKK